MITDVAFPFFARRKHSTSPLPRNLKDSGRGRRVFGLWRRREQTTFQKCLAVHMYYAAPHRAQR
jgi:hypothetical protein